MAQCDAYIFYKYQKVFNIELDFFPPYLFSTVPCFQTEIEFHIKSSSLVCFAEECHSPGFIKKYHQIKIKTLNEVKHLKIHCQIKFYHISFRYGFPPYTQFFEFRTVPIQHEELTIFAMLESLKYQWFRHLAVMSNSLVH